MRVPIRETNCVFGMVIAGQNNFDNTMWSYRTGRSLHILTATSVIDSAAEVGKL